MPELCRFGGMVIVMLFKDTKQHNKPHVHVYYGEYEASVGLDGEFWRVLYLVYSIKYWLDGCFIMRKQFIRLGI